MGILEIFQRRAPISFPLLLRMQHEGFVVEEFWRHVLFDRRGAAIAHPHKHQSLERSCWVGPGICAASADLARPNTLAEERLRRSVLVERQAVIRAGNGAREPAFAVS